MSAALLEARQLRVAVAGRVLVDGFDDAIAAGEFIALLGGNGTGKSLLMQTLGGLRLPAAGQVLLDGHDLATLARRAIARRLGFLPQDPEAPPQGSLFESVMLGRFAHLGFWERSGADDEQRAQRALEDVELGALGRRTLASLSGGEQRRAAIARLLVQAPSIYLLDEPTNHLDPGQQLGMLARMRALAAAGGAVIASLHDPNLALRFADRIWLLSGSGPVTVVRSGALEPAHLERLYGVEYAETRVGERRFMAPGTPGNRSAPRSAVSPGGNHPRS
ncbi:MAG TPA: ABC transporter ATP-binding protein [Steroidobacteraceae bacterium]|nr:ABC transporter ATP-binding protein [Steroidobacteraceae bacterium]